MLAKTRLLLQVLRKIPVFYSLPPSQVQRLVALCQMRDLEEGELLCRHDSPSDEMYILLAGEVTVSTAGGLRVATIRPVTTVGEMGVITGQPRSATVASTQACRVLVLLKDHFEAVFEEDPAQHARVLRNFIQILADRVTGDNLRMRDYEDELRRFHGTALGLETRIHQDEARISALAGLIERSGAMSMEEGLAAIEHTPTVLVVDDEADFCRLVRESLDHVAIVEAADGAQALSTLETLDADLVIIDIRMPGVDGLELLDRIRVRYPSLPVIVVSGQVDEKDINNRGFSAFIDKPLRVADFRQLVDRTLATPPG